MWEVTVEDILIVLRRHKSRAFAYKVFDEYFVGNNNQERVEKAVLCYVDFDFQCDAGLSEIENILMEAKVISGEKLFFVSDLDELTLDDYEI
jgi:hypothetical protein